MPKCGFLTMHERDGEKQFDGIDLLEHHSVHLQPIINLGQAQDVTRPSVGSSIRPSLPWACGAALDLSN